MKTNDVSVANRKLASRLNTLEKSRPRKAKKKVQMADPYLCSKGTCSTSRLTRHNKRPKHQHLTKDTSIRYPGFIRLEISMFLMYN